MATATTITTHAHGKDKNEKDGKTTPGVKKLKEGVVGASRLSAGANPVHVGSSSPADFGKTPGSPLYLFSQRCLQVRPSQGDLAFDSTKIRAEFDWKIKLLLWLN